MDVGADLRRCRIGAGLSQQALADIAGTSQPTVAAYEARTSYAERADTQTTARDMRLHDRRRA